MKSAIYIFYLATSETACPEDGNGRFPVPGQCDAYIDCFDGVGEEKLCPDGLLFNEKITSLECDYPNKVDCGTRANLQEAQPTDDCPHQFGYYRTGDKNNCEKFMNCASGRGYVLECPEGLAYNSQTYHCDWPDLVPDCDAEAYLGFNCPKDEKVIFPGDEEYHFYPSPTNCQKYFICIGGKPRMIDCGEGYGFNTETNACDSLENITCSS